MSEDNNTQLPLEQLRQIRIDKLKKLTDLGIDPYPSQSQRTNTNIEIKENYDDMEGKEVTVTGRIMSWREHGELIFVDLQDEDDSIQLYIHKSELADLNSSLQNLGESELKLLDMGDFIEAKGVVTKTKRGEVSVAPSIVRLLSKSLRPLPSAHYGLKDEEDRFRQRYAELAINPELRELFIKKSKFWNGIRSFMIEKGFVEVETPVLETTAGGADANPFVTHHNALDMDVYLRISMGELWQKRLMVGGFEKTFELGRQFRNEGMSREHLQDYTQMEFYWAYADYEDSMQLVEKMYKKVLVDTFGTSEFEIGGHKVDLNQDWGRLDYSSAILEKFNIDISSCDDTEIRSKLDELGARYEMSDKRGRLIDILWKQMRSEVTGPVFLVNHPVEVSPLAKRNEDKPGFVERYQIIIAGSELGNGYSELNDPLDQAERFLEQQKMRDEGDEEAQMHDQDFVRALEYGMPPTTGFGISERVFSFFANKPIRECVLFPLLKPEFGNEKSKVEESQTAKKDQSDSTESTLAITKDQAIELLHKHMENTNLRRHSYGVGYAMTGIYDYLSNNDLLKENEPNRETWEVFGILHDSDYEITKDNWENHTLMTLEWLKDLGVGQKDPLYLAEMSHNTKITGLRDPQTQMEWSLECCDELTGFIVACALVKDDKKLASVTLDTIKRKWGQRAFARNVEREQIEQCEERLGINLDDFISVVLTSMQKNSKELGL